MGKVYAIKEGFDSKKNEKVENKIVSTWDECKIYVNGVKGAVYKGFTSMKEAEEFLSEGDKLLIKGRDEYPQDCLHIYVDGSYDDTTSRYSYGLVAVRDNVIEYIESGADKANSKNNIRQVAGELESAIKGVQYALNKGDKKVVLIFDYYGIAHHVTGYWKRESDSAKEYYKKMSKLINQGIEVIFVKVFSHTNDLFNELVDEKCKERLSIASDKLVEKYLLNDIIKVTNEEIRQQIVSIAQSGEKNVQLANQVTTPQIMGKDINDGEDNFLIYVINEYKKNPILGEQLINRLSGDEKTKLIKYLLDKK